MADNIKTLTERELPSLPVIIAEFVALDMTGRKIHVDPRKIGDTHLLTWLDRCRAIGYKFGVVSTELDRVIQLRQEGFRAPARSSLGENEEAPLENRDAALTLLFRAESYRASDIHILLRGSHTEIQFRIKGDLRVAGRISQQEGEAICRAFYQGIAVAKDASFTPLEVQGAQISGAVLQDSSLTSVRIVRGPAYPVEENGAFMVLRLQYAQTNLDRTITAIARTALLPPRAPEGELRLQAMGYSATQSERLTFLHEGSSGIVIFTGPTGSGKTTAINELMKELARRSPSKRQIAIEDPIEYPMPWAVQLVITNQLQSNMFAKYLKDALRMDPDKLFLGEVRDAEAALAAIMAALTGHQVDTTMHVTDPYTVPDRIEIMDPMRLPRRMFCNSKIIRGIVNQRLIPRVCRHCSIPMLRKEAPALHKRLKSALETYGDLHMVRLRGPGCAECSFDSIRDRIAVAEVIATDRDLMADFLDKGADTARKNFRARAASDHSILHATMQRVLAGEVDPRDVGEAVDVVVNADQVDD